MLISNITFLLRIFEAQADVDISSEGFERAELDSISCVVSGYKFRNEIKAIRPSFPQPLCSFSSSLFSIIPHYSF